MLTSMHWAGHSGSMAGGESSANYSEKPAEDQSWDYCAWRGSEVVCYSHVDLFQLGGGTNKPVPTLEPQESSCGYLPGPFLALPS